MKMLVIGDSHVSVFTGTDLIAPVYPFSYCHGNMEIFRVGAFTAHNISKRRDVISEIIKKNINADVVIFHFGEIDCRVHLPVICSDEYEDVEPIKETVNRYIEEIKYLSFETDSRIVVFAPQPIELEEKSYEDEHPVKGSQGKRDFITNAFSGLLREKCLSNNFGFVTVVKSFDKEKIKNKMHLGKDEFGIIEKEFAAKGIELLKKEDNINPEVCMAVFADDNEELRKSRIDIGNGELSSFKFKEFGMFVYDKKIKYNGLDFFEYVGEHFKKDGNGTILRGTVVLNNNNKESK
jgi:hypothetical protein